VRFSRYASGCISHEEDVIAVGQALDHRHREADFRPQRCDDELLPPGLLHLLDDALVLPCVNEGPIDRLLRGKDLLDDLEEVATAFLGDGRQDRWDLERPRCLRKPTTLLMISVARAVKVGN